MISIIISSYKPANILQLKPNLEETIGVEYELIVIENKGQMSINGAYNQGLVNAKYDILLFLHDDVQINNIGWGKSLVDIYNSDAKIGLVGLAGATAKSKAPSAWWTNGDLNNYIYLRQFHNGSFVGDFIDGGDAVLIPNRLYETLLLDGVFIAMHKRSALTFDERLEGFHNYDVAISVNSHLQGWKNVVSTHIDLTHFSGGTLDGKWIKSCDQFYRLYKNDLPVAIENVKEPITQKREWDNYMDFIRQSLNFGERRIALRHCFYLWKIAYRTKRPYVMLKKIILGNK